MTELQRRYIQRYFEQHTKGWLWRYVIEMAEWILRHGQDKAHAMSKAERN